MRCIIHAARNKEVKISERKSQFREYRGKHFTTVPCLEKVRTERGFTRSQLALLVGLDDSQVLRIEQGRRTTLETLGKLATVLNVESLEDLLLSDEDHDDAEQMEKGELVAT